MRIRKRLAAISAGLGAHPRVQPPADSPQLPLLSQGANSTAGCTPPETAAANPHRRSKELQVIHEGSTKSASHVYKQQVPQTRHLQADSRVSHDYTQLAVSRSKPPAMDVCAAAGLVQTSHGASPSVSFPASGHTHAGGTVPTLPFSKHTVEAAYDSSMAHECKMASCADPNKAARMQYSDNASWWHGRSRLEAGDQEVQTSNGASLAYALPGSADAHECKENDLRDEEYTSACRRGTAATSLTQHFSNAQQWSTSLPSSSADDADKVDMLSTPGTEPERPRNRTPNSFSTMEDHVKWAEHMSINEESAWVGDNGDLQRLARDLIRNNVSAGMKVPGCNDNVPGCNDNKACIVHETASTPLKQKDARTDYGDIASSDSGEDERCCRRSGQGWRCKNMRAADRSSIYCDYHQLKIQQNHATWNARNKTLKENKRKRELIETHASIQPLQNKMVDVKMFELPLLPSKQHMYENVQAHEAISSEVGAIFRRMFQAAAGMEKQQLSNMGTHQNTTALPSLAESVVRPIRPCTLDAQENLESQAGQLNNLKFKRRRIEKIDEVPEHNVGGDEKNTGGGLLAEKLEHGAISVHCKMNDVVELLGASREELDQKSVRCKRVNGKGWRCGNMTAPNSAYCHHHQTKLSKRYKKRSGGKSRTQPTHFVRDINTMAAAHSMIDPGRSVQATEDGDAGNLKREMIISMGDDRAQDEMYENGYQEEKKSVQHGSERGNTKKQCQVLHEGLQEDMECGIRDNGGCNRLHVKQLQEEQLRWWEYKQGGNDCTFTSQKAGNTGKQVESLLLPRRSERRLIIDVCKSTAAEHQQIEGKMGAHLDPECHLLNSDNLAAANIDEPLQLCTSSGMIAPKPQCGEIEPTDMKNAQKMQGSEQRQCKRHDGRGWRCKRVCPQGQFYCEHHLRVMRNYVERTDAKTRGGLQQQQAVVTKHAGELQKLSPNAEEKSLRNELELHAVVTEKMGHMQQVCGGSCGAGNDIGSIARDAAKHRSDAAKEQMKQAGQCKRNSSDLQEQKRRADQSQRQIQKSKELVHKLEQVASMEPPGLPRHRRQAAAPSQNYEVHKQVVAGSAEPPGEQELAINGEKNDKPQQELIKLTKQEPVQEGQRRCGRHDGRGWRCKSMCKEGSLYCEYHREKLRKNHASWNAKKLQEKKTQNSVQAAGKGKEEAGVAVVEERRAATMTVRAMKKALVKKRMRSLHDIEARL